MSRATAVKLEILWRRPFADGHGFGEAGTYEHVHGRARIGVDPASVPDDAVVDLDLAERCDEGRVWLTTQFDLLRPHDPARASGRLLFDYGNRGNKRALQFFNDAPHTNRPRSAADAGNGFLMRQGYVVLWAGWQADLLPGDDRMLLEVPVVRRNGAAVTGTVRSEFVVERPGARVLPLSGRVNTRSHPAVSLDTAKARFTRRRYPESDPIEIAADRWAFAREERGFGLDDQGGEAGIVASDGHVFLPAGFEPGWIYELEYEGRDPLVLGLGHVAVRDLVGFLRHRTEDDRGTASPIADLPLAKCYAWGRSQTGRCIRDFVYLGFNADAAGRKVFDGMFPHVSGGGRMNLDRFANLTYGGSTQYEDRNSDTDRFPFAYAPVTHPRTGVSDAILKRPEHDPLIVHTQSSTEYWQRRGSLVHTDAEGNALPEVDGARIYLWSSSQHLSNPRLEAPKRGIGQNMENVVQTSFLFRALLLALDRWATDGTPPPPSRIPRREDGTLGTLAAWRNGFPAIPAVMLPTSFHELDGGAGFTVLVPLTDVDGNERAGIRVPMVEAPLGTYTGWNVRSRGQAQGALVSLAGSYLPFPEDAETARRCGDSRRPVVARYATAEAYRQAIQVAAHELVAVGLMLEEDVADALRLAENWGRPRHVPLL